MYMLLLQLHRVSANSALHVSLCQKPSICAAQQAITPQLLQRTLLAPLFMIAKSSLGPSDAWI